MDLRDIQELASDEGVYQRGLQYFEEEKVLEIEQDENGRYTALVQGQEKVWRVVVDVGMRQSIGYYSCSCPAFRNFYGACKHIVAVLFQIRLHRAAELRRLKAEKMAAADPEVQKIKRQQKVQKQVKQFLTWARERNRRPVEIEDSSAETFRVVPTLHFDEGDVFYLSLAIGQGINRAYVVKNITNFCQQVRTGEKTSYGKQKPVVHWLHNFEPDSAGLVEMVLNREREWRLWQQAQLQDGSRETPKIGRDMLLLPAGLDQLFERWQGHEMIFLHEPGQKWTARLEKEEPPHYVLELSRAEEGKVCLQAEVGWLLKGERWNYLLSGGHCFRLERRETNTLKNLLLLFENSPEGRLMLTEEDFRDLDANILRLLQPLAQLQAPEELLQAYRAIPLIVRLYIDQPDNEKITGKLSFCYGEQTISAFGDAVSFPGRDWAGEEQAKKAVLQYFSLAAPEKGEEFFANGEDAIYRFATDGLQQLEKIMEIYASDRFKRMKLRKMPEIQTSIRLENDWLDLSLDTEGISLEEWAAIFQAYRLKKKYFRLRNGDFLHLDEEKMETMTSLLEGVDFLDLPQDKGENDGLQRIRLPQYRALFLEKLLEEHPEISCRRDEAFAAFIARVNQNQQDFPIPESLRGTLRDYQKNGFQWLMTMKQYGFGGILADDMGLGKTLQIITLLLAEKEAGEDKHTLITCPASLVYNWQAEVQKFAPTLTTLALIGNSAERQEKLQRISAYDITITSYDLLRRDAEQYKGVVFDYHVLDEAQYIKNQNTRSAKSVREIKSRQRFALTGTPIENNAAELWSVFDFLMPQYLYSYGQFKERFEKPIVREGNRQALHRLNQMTSPFLLRRMKSEVLQELPDKTETMVSNEMEEEQRKLYQANLLLMRQDFQKRLQEKGLSSSRFVLLSVLMRLRQLCCHPQLCYEDYRGGSGKLELCMEIVRNSVEAGHKILLFSQFTSMLAIIGERMKKEKLDFYCLQGSTSKEERARMVQAFQSDDTPVFLISLKAGGTGLNLTAADIVIHYDPWWNVSAQNQATDRVHRIGQRKNVQVYQLITRDSIEEKILTLQQRKKELADSIIGQGRSMISTMSAEEILSLFE